MAFGRYIWGTWETLIISVKIKKITRNLITWGICFRKKYHPEVIWLIITYLGNIFVTGFVNESKERPLTLHGRAVAELVGGKILFTFMISSIYALKKKGIN